VAMRPSTAPMAPISPTPPTAPGADPFRRRLLDGLADSLAQRGYRATTVADIVRSARTSKRTFYDRFAGKDACFLELLAANEETLRTQIRAAVDPDADWRAQIRSAVDAYITHIAERPAITLSWIRELPSLGAAARPVQRRGLHLLTALLVELTGSAGFRRAGLPPLTAPLAVILLGGIRELTALAVEDGREVSEIAGPATEAAVALLGPRRPG